MINNIDPYIPYVYCNHYKIIAVTDDILIANDCLSGDHITNAAARSLIQIYELEIKKLNKF